MWLEGMEERISDAALCCSSFPPLLQKEKNRGEKTLKHLMPGGGGVGEGGNHPSPERIIETALAFRKSCISSLFRVQRRRT